MISHNKPFIDKNSLNVISDMFESKWINYGSISKLTEEKLSKLVYNTSNNTALLTNATSALYLALKALGVKKEDEVIVPSYTCTALLNAIYMADAKAVICDVSKENLSLTKEFIVPHITKNTKVIIVVHTFGIPCEINEIEELKIPIIEDCSQSLGSCFKDGSIVGSKGIISVFSFSASKLITGGIGGAISSLDKNIMGFINDYINFDSPQIYKKRFNFQISDINSAVILESLNRLDEILAQRRETAAVYQEVVDSEYNSIKGVNNYRFIISFKSEDELKKCQGFLFDKGINTRPPIENYELLHNYLGLDKSDYKNSEYLSKRILSIPIFNALSKKEIGYIREVLSDYFSASTGI